MRRTGWGSTYWDGDRFEYYQVELDPGETPEDLDFRLGLTADDITAIKQYRQLKEAFAEILTIK